MRTEIVWLEDPTKYSYLREHTRLTCSPKQIALKTPIFDCQAKIIGYEIIHREKNEKSPRVYLRRIWGLKTYDRDLDPESVYKYHVPIEAVIPESISVGGKSQRYGSSGKQKEDLDRWVADGKPSFDREINKWVIKEHFVEHDG